MQQQQSAPSITRQPRGTERLSRAGPGTVGSSWEALKAELLSTRSGQSRCRAADAPVKELERLCSRLWTKVGWMHLYQEPEENGSHRGWMASGRRWGQSAGRRLLVRMWRWTGGLSGEGGSPKRGPCGQHPGEPYPAREEGGVAELTATGLAKRSRANVGQEHYRTYGPKLKMEQKGESYFDES